MCFTENRHVIVGDTRTGAPGGAHVIAAADAAVHRKEFGK